MRLGVMLLAAGYGKRLRPFTEVYPKSVMPVLGVPLLELNAAGSDALAPKVMALNYHARSDEMQTSLCEIDKRRAAGGRMALSRLHEDVLLGSAGGMIHVAHAYPEIERWVFINSDVLFDLSWEALLRFHAEQVKRGIVMTMALAERAMNTDPYSEILIDSNSRVTGHIKAHSRGWFYGGIAVIEAEALKKFPDQEVLDFIPTLFEPWVQAGLVVGMPQPRKFFWDFGSPELYFRGHFSLLERLKAGDQAECRGKEFLRLWHERGSWLQANVWAVQGSKELVRRFELKLQGPLVFGLDQSALSLQQVFGPEAILYGTVRPPAPFSSGIWIDGMQWLRIEDRH